MLKFGELFIYIVYIYADLQEVRLQIMIVVPFLCKLLIYSCNSYKFVCLCGCMGACDCALSLPRSLLYARSHSMILLCFGYALLMGSLEILRGLRRGGVVVDHRP